MGDTGFDVVIENGLVIDGTGGPGRALDVAVRGERIAELFPRRSVRPAIRRIDASGKVVTPGFIDIHTHLDAQVFWDPYCTPSSCYGVTTAVIGNCGFAIAPLREDDNGYMKRLLSEVEAIPVKALDEGVPWDWRSFEDYLRAVAAARPAINVAAMAGHSALRRAALGDDHADPEPGEQTMQQMRTLLEEAIDAGAFGFSSSWNSIHFDGDGGPVPSRSAPVDELLRLCSVLQEFPGSQIEFIPTVGRFEDSHVDLMIEMSIAGAAPLNWNVLIPQDPAVVEEQLRASDAAAERGARVLALTYPGPTTVRASAASRLFRSIPGWTDILDLPPAGAAAALHDRDLRNELRHFALSNRTALARIVGDLIVSDVHAQETAGFVGMRLEDVAAAVGGDPFDALFTLWAADGARAGLLPEPMANSEDSWRARMETWSDPRVLIGASDAGAHVQMLSTFDYPVVLIALARERGGLSLPAVIRKLTDVPARLYGVQDRGRIEVGAFADMVVFDPETIAPGAPGWRDDLPGGAGRIYTEPIGMAHVIVNGTEIVGPGGLTSERPGRVLRRGLGAG